MQSHVGPVELYAKAYAVPGDADDLNSVSGMTKIFSMIEEGSVKIFPKDGFGKIRAEGYLADIGKYRNARSMTVTMNVKPQSAEEMTLLLGLLAGDMTTESGDTPKRKRVRSTVNDPINFYNGVLRFRDPETPTLYVGFYLLKFDIEITGEMGIGQGTEASIPITLELIAPTSGTFSDVLWEYYQEYELTTPVITSILLASQSVGDIVVISGTGFGASQGAGVVTFFSAKTAVTYYSWTDNFIAVKIPVGAVTGNVTVTNAAGGVSAGVSYTVV